MFPYKAKRRDIVFLRVGWIMIRLAHSRYQIPYSFHILSNKKSLIAGIYVPSYATRLSLS